MALTEFGVNHPSARKIWGSDLMAETAKSMPLGKFMGTGDNAIIKVQTELNRKAGDKLTVELVRKLNGWGAEGDDVLEGTSHVEALNFFTDSLLIDQLRKATQSKGKMSEQRVPHNLRNKARDALKMWWAEVYGELIMIYLSGARGVDTSFKAASNFTGFAGNALTTPDTIVYSGNATEKADVDSSDVFTLGTIEKCVAIAETRDPMLRPVMVDGELKWVLVMHTFDAFNLRNSSTDGDWKYIQAHAGTRGSSNLIYKNALGEYAGVVLHKDRNVIRFADYGAGQNLPATRSLFLGAHAGIIAWAKEGGMGRMSWVEKGFDFENSLAVSSGAIFGVKRSTYTDSNGANAIDNGVIAIDSYCANIAA